MKRVVVIAIAFSALTASAQQRVATDFNAMKQNAIMTATGQAKGDGIAGSPYLQEQFVPGRIKNVNDVQALRYNAGKDQFEFKNNDVDYIVPKQEAYDEITLTATGEKYKLVRYTDKNDKPVFGYLVELYNANQMGLYRRDVIIIRKGRMADSGYVSSTPDTWVKGAPEYYVLKKDGTIATFPKNAKAVSKMYVGKETDVKMFFKENKVDFDEKADMIKVVELMSTL